MKTRYFTLGQGHVHSFKGHTLDKDCIIKITDENPRKVMTEAFNDKWAFEYEAAAISENLNLFNWIYDLTNDKWIKIARNDD